MSDAFVSPETVKRRSGQFDLASVRELEYAGCGVREVCNLEPCVGLVRADFSNNRVRYTSLPAAVWVVLTIPSPDPICRLFNRSSIARSAGFIRK
jgi:hypothetical protein